MHQVTADLTVGRAVRVSNGRHTWAADEPLDLDGTDIGPNPYELLLGALGACTCVTVAMFCRRKGWRLDSISATFSYDKIHSDDCADCDSDQTGWLDTVTSEVFIEGDFDEAAAARVKEVAHRCPVHRTLEKPMRFTESIIVN